MIDRLPLPLPLPMPLLAACLAGAAVAAGPGASATVAQTAAPATLVLTLGPAPAHPPGASIGTLDVAMRIDGPRIPAGEPVLAIAHLSDNVDTVATSVTGLDVRDRRGSLRLTARDVGPPGDDAERVRQWIADRAVDGPLRVRYTVPAKATRPPRGTAGPRDLVDDGNGISAVGDVFLLLPPRIRDYTVIASWDLTRLPPGAIGLSSLGEGDAPGGKRIASRDLREVFFMAGRIRTWPQRRTDAGFIGAWQGTPSFDAAALMRWTNDLYGGYRRFFGRTDDRAYSVFLRYSAANAGGGMGFHDSFVNTYGAGRASDPEALKSTLAHEMFHTFQPYIDEGSDNGALWFGEGLATFYQARLPFRYGLMTAEQFLADLNEGAGRYYTSIMATQPNAMVVRHFWDDTRVRTLPYDRGMLYFVTVDDAVRKASGGKRSLDDLMLRMLEIRGGGRTLTDADWEALLYRELGAPAVARFRASLAGAMPLPASDAFGPCFARTTARLRRYEVGFDPSVFRGRRRIVRGLVPGSAADIAGLRNGDEILTPIAQDAIQGDQTQVLTLPIRRPGRTLTIAYLPRGETVDAYQWRRIPGIPDARCGV